MKAKNANLLLNLSLNYYYAVGLWQFIKKN